MKTVLPFLYVTLVMAGFSQCSSQKMVAKGEEPFKLGEIYAEPFSGGAAGMASGTNLFIPVEEGKEIELDSVYYHGKAVKLEKVQRDSYLVYIGRFVNDDESPRDIIMHADPKKEVGNQPPPLRKKLPIELKENEAVISFKQGKELKYFKLDSIKQSTPVFYPSVRKNGQ